jgi:hypothetical protein
MICFDDTQSSMLARHWLILWADCWRARRSRRNQEIYAGGPGGAKEYRPKDDPDPMLFVFAQVEYCLGPHEGWRWKFAEHVWIERRAIEEFAHPEMRSSGRTYLYDQRVKLLKRLGWQIRLKAPEAITSETVLSAKRRVGEERRGARRDAAPG